MAPALPARPQAPNFFFLHYDRTNWTVRNLLLIPHFAFPPSAIIKRKPLSVTARRAGWVGCNFALNRIPLEARIPVITEKQILPAAEVRAKFQKVKPLQQLSVQQRGWTLDVLNLIRRLTEEKRQRAGALQDASRNPKVVNERISVLECGGPPPLSPATDHLEFTNADLYTYAPELEKLHPDNRHVKDKIRQQLQVLRDTGLLQHLAPALWRLP